MYLLAPHRITNGRLTGIAENTGGMGAYALHRGH
jgi:hypothetical protein